jgi:hypothetical protein
LDEWEISLPFQHAFAVRRIRRNRLVSHWRPFRWQQLGEHLTNPSSLA